MAENLRATCFRDGSSIASISSGENAAWKANTTGAYLASTDYDWLQVAGYMYNGYCVTSEKASPRKAGKYHRPSNSQNCAPPAVLAAANFKASDFGMWSEGMTGNNITGFDAVATGTYANGDITGLYSGHIFLGLYRFHQLAPE